MSVEEPRLVPIERLLFKEPVTAGADIFTIAALVKFYRGCNEHAEPIVLTPVIPYIVEGGPFWRIQDGRHRVIASIIAGRKAVLAVDEWTCAICGEHDVEDAGDHADKTGHWPKRRLGAERVIG